jgi:hypothetical protein
VNRGNSYRNGRVHVQAEMCKTCIFRPGNLMMLEPGRLSEMVREARGNNSAVICHSTLDGPNAVCKGFFDRHATQTLQIAERLGKIEWVTA